MEELNSTPTQNQGRDKDLKCQQISADISLVESQCGNENHAHKTAEDIVLRKSFFFHVTIQLVQEYHIRGLGIKSAEVGKSSEVHLQIK